MELASLFCGARQVLKIGESKIVERILPLSLKYAAVVESLTNTRAAIQGKDIDQFGPEKVDPLQWMGSLSTLVRRH